MDVINMEVCNEQYDGIVTPNMICASRDGKDACIGDSGGPLIILGDEDILVGVVSFGNGCADPDYARVYASVSSQYKWIENEIANGVRPSDDWLGGGDEDCDDDCDDDDDIDYYLLQNPILYIWYFVRTFIDNFLLFFSLMTSTTRNKMITMVTMIK